MLGFCIFIHVFPLPYKRGGCRSGKALTLEGKIAYSILRDRLSLSVKNNWVNESGEVFLKFKRADLMQLLECSKTTIAKIIKELQVHELIFEKRVGRGMTNEIYICHVDLSEIIPTKPVKTPEVQKMDSIVILILTTLI